MKKEWFDISIFIYLSQSLFQLYLEVYYNIQFTILIDLFIFIENDWIQYKSQYQYNILDIIDLYEKEKRIYHYDFAIKKYNIEIITLF